MFYFLQKNLLIVFLTCMSLVFFVLYGYLGFISPAAYNSPDESANYFFSNLLAKEKTLKYEEPLNKETDNLVHPRSMTANDGFILPGSFLGFVAILGTFAKILGTAAIPFVTPLFAALAPLFFFWLLKKIMADKQAFLTAVLLLLHPAFWYYSLRSLYPNVLFCSFLIIAFCCLVYINSGLSYKKWLLLSSGGLALGLALVIRTNEVTWICLALLLLWLNYRKQIKLRSYWLFGLLVVIGILPAVYYNWQTFGSPIFTGYFEFNNLLQNTTQTTVSWQNILGQLFNLIFFPFGIDLKNIFWSSYYYLFLIFIGFCVPAFIGFCLLIWRLFKERKLTLPENKAWKTYLEILVATSLFLVLYYGSFVFKDTISHASYTLGTSYVRYYLPLYILSLPLISYFLFAIGAWLKNRFSKISIKLGILPLIFTGLLFFSYSVYLVYFWPPENIFAVVSSIKRGLWEAQGIHEFLNQDKYKNRVLLVDSEDKYFFPAEKVMTGLTDEKNWPVIARLVDQKYTVWYFGQTLPETDLQYLNEKKLAGYKIILKLFKIENPEILKNKSLYVFRKIK